MNYIVYAPGIIGAALLIATLFHKALIDIFLVAEPILVSVFALGGGILLFMTYFKTPKSDRSSIGINVVCGGILLANLPYIFSTFLRYDQEVKHYEVRFKTC